MLVGGLRRTGVGLIDVIIGNLYVPSPSWRPIR